MRRPSLPSPEAFWITISPTIKNFADPLTGKLFYGEDLTKKEAGCLGDILLQVEYDLSKAVADKDLQIKREILPAPKLAMV